MKIKFESTFEYVEHQDNDESFMEVRTIRISEVRSRLGWSRISLDLLPPEDQGAHNRVRASLSLSELVELSDAIHRKLREYSKHSQTQIGLSEIADAIRETHQS